MLTTVPLTLLHPDRQRIPNKGALRRQKLAATLTSNRGRNLLVSESGQGQLNLTKEGRHFHAHHRVSHLVAPWPEKNDKQRSPPASEARDNSYLESWPNVSGGRGRAGTFVCKGWEQTH